jgi:hypothetical protein
LTWIIRREPGSQTKNTSAGEVKNNYNLNFKVVLRSVVE